MDKSFEIIGGDSGYIKIEIDDYRKEVLEMNICGLQKTTLLDYPGHVAATIFLGGCNFRCPFCHNGDLLYGPFGNHIPEADIFNFLKKRASVLEGVCITGGEPTLQPGLEAFIVKIKELELSVKLDTNGYRPDVLKTLCGKGLIDYVAMDIKSGKSGYGKAAGCAGLELSKIEESIQFLMGQTVPFEFRTTVVRELHTAEDFKEIGPWLDGSPLYFLQNFENSDQVLTPGFSSYTKEELTAFKDLVSPYIRHVELRGID